MTIERWIVRVYVAAAFVAAIAATVALEVPDTLPAITFHTELVFVAERGLVLFYVALLAMLPLVRSVSRGDMPIEVSTRGARYQELTTESEGSIERLTQAINEQGERLRIDEITSDEIVKRVGELEGGIRSRAAEEGRLSP